VRDFRRSNAILARAARDSSIRVEGCFSPAMFGRSRVSLVRCGAYSIEIRFERGRNRVRCRRAEPRARMESAWRDSTLHEKGIENVRNRPRVLLSSRIPHRERQAGYNFVLLAFTELYQALIEASRWICGTRFPSPINSTSRIYTRGIAINKTSRR